MSHTTPKTSILLIYTGGTIGMMKNPVTGALENFNFDQLLEYVPEIKGFNLNIYSLAFDPPLDSSDISPESWSQLAQIIYSNYEQYDGFVILHGTDTMAFTASALSFMLEGLMKPVILTGSHRYFFSKFAPFSDINGVCSYEKELDFTFRYTFCSQRKCAKKYTQGY